MRENGNTIVDFEDIIDEQDERDMPVYVVWLAIESKHLNGIARFWTLVMIVIQCAVFVLIILMYYYISLIEFFDNEGHKSKLTTILFVNSDGKAYYNMIFSYFAFVSRLRIRRPGDFYVRFKSYLDPRLCNLQTKLVAC